MTAERERTELAEAEVRQEIQLTEEALRELKRFYWLKLLLYE